MKRAIIILLSALAFFSCDEEYINEIKGETQKKVKTVTVEHFRYNDGVLSTTLDFENKYTYDVNGHLLEFLIRDNSQLLKRVSYSYDGDYLIQEIDSSWNNDWWRIDISDFYYNCDNDTCLCNTERIYTMSSKMFLPDNIECHNTYNEFNQLTQSVFFDEEQKSLTGDDTTSIWTYYKNEKGLDTLIIWKYLNTSGSKYRYLYDSYNNILIEEQEYNNIKNILQSNTYEYDEKGRISIKMSLEKTKYEYTYLKNDSIDYIETSILSGKTGNFEKFEKTDYSYEYFKK